MNPVRQALKAICRLRRATLTFRGGSADQIVDAQGHFCAVMYEVLPHLLRQLRALHRERMEVYQCHSPSSAKDAANLSLAEFVQTRYVRREEYQALLQKLENMERRQPSA